MSFAVIFDMDGVIVDSITSNLKGHQAALAHFGISVDLKDIKEDKHLSPQDKITKWKQKYDVEVEQKNYIDKAVEMQLKLLHELEAENGVLALLSELKEHKIKLAVATNSTFLKTKAVLCKIGLFEYFDAIITSEEVEKRKPDPEMFLLAASRLNTKAEKCIVFEDAGTGVLAAKAANMKAIGYKTKYNTRDELKHADLIIENFNELNYEKLEELIKKSETQ